MKRREIIKRVLLLLLFLTIEGYSAIKEKNVKLLTIDYDKSIKERTLDESLFNLIVLTPKDKNRLDEIEQHKNFFYQLFKKAESRDDRYAVELWKSMVNHLTLEKKKILSQKKIESEKLASADKKRLRELAQYKMVFEKRLEYAKFWGETSIVQRCTQNILKIKEEKEAILK